MIVYLERDVASSIVYDALGNGADPYEEWDIQPGCLQAAQLRDRERFTVFDAVRQELGLERLCRLLAEGDSSMKSIELLPAGAGYREIGLVERGQGRPFGPHQISDGTLPAVIDFQTS